MKSEIIKIRTTPSRYNKLKLLAKQREVTITRIIEELIDALEDPKSTAT